ncbi:MAG: DMT family transporter [Alphaproteobacteria bacterium]|nr:DMT family transporter [Alphaproteobacteria bacterium]
MIAPQPETGSLATGYAMVGVVALFFGIAPSFARLAFDGGVGALTLQLLRFGLCAGVLWTLVLATRLPRHVPRGRLVALLALAATTGLASYGYMTSVRHVPVPLASLTFFVFPLMVAPLAHLAGHERLTVRRMVALGIGFLGLALMLGADVSHADPLGIGLAFGAGSCVAVSFLLTRRLANEIAPMVLSAQVTTIATVAYAFLAAAEGGLEPPTDTRGWIGLITNAGCYAVGLSFLYASIRRLGSVRVAVVVNLEPVISVLTAWIVLDQVLEPLQAVGAAVVLAGIALVQTERRVPAPDTI